MEVGKARPTIGEPPCGVTMSPPLTKPMNRMKRPMPTPIALLRASGTAFMMASRSAEHDEDRDDHAFQHDDAHAPAGVRPLAGSVKATMALMPRPAARANG